MGFASRLSWSRGSSWSVASLIWENKPAVVPSFLLNRQSPSRERETPVGPDLNSPGCCWQRRESWFHTHLLGLPEGPWHADLLTCVSWILINKIKVHGARGACCFRKFVAEAPVHKTPFSDLNSRSLYFLDWGQIPFKNSFIIILATLGRISLGWTLSVSKGPGRDPAF